MRSEDAILPPRRKLTKAEVEDFCSDFLKDNSSLLFTPFISEEVHEQYGELPENYVKTLLFMADKYQKEKARYTAERGGLADHGLQGGVRTISDEQVKTVTERLTEFEQIISRR